MHDQARRFTEYCRSVFPGWFAGGRVLDVGAGDINGNNRFLFDACEYVGCDVAPAPNVDIVSPCHELEFSEGTFHTIISTECLEHDMHYPRTLKKIVDMLRPGGMFVFTCASTGRAEHGTRRTKPCDSYTTCTGNEQWADYYKNLTAEDVCEVLPIGDIFSYHRFYYEHDAHDLYFVGIKAGGPELVDVPPNYA